MKRGRNQRRRQGVNVNRALDSNGPDVRIRGTANQIYDKYQTLARDASSAGDRVKAESYLQHAEHYFRLIKSLQPANVPTQNTTAGEQPDVDDRDESDETNAESSRDNTRDEQNARPNNRQRDAQRDNQRDGRRRRPAPEASADKANASTEPADKEAQAPEPAKADQPVSTEQPDTLAQAEEKPEVKKPVRRTRKKRVPASESAEAG